MPIFAFVMSAIGPWVKQALVAIGVGVVSYAAVSTLIEAAKTQVVSNWSAMGGPVAEILGLFGFGTSISIVLGGVAARGALMAVSHFGKV
jgi:hypothetical protein